MADEPGADSPSATSTAGEASSRSEHAASDRDDDPGDQSAVLPRFEEPDSATDEAVSAAVVPQFEEPGPSIPDAVMPRFEIPESELVIPTFDEPSHGSVLDPPPAPEPRSTRSEPDAFGISGPEYDQEMPLADHIEEMIKRLAVIIVIAGSVTLVTFPFADQLINFLWYSILPGGDVAQPRVYGPLEFLLTQIKVASLVGLVVALPVLVYESYAFMRPGLYEHERRYYLAAIPTSLVLAIVGMAFAYFIVLPAIFTYFLAYSQEAGEIAFALAQTFDLMLILMAYLAIVFQIPLFIMLAIMMGLTTRRWLADKRLYFWGAFLGLAFISSPDPTGMAPIIIALTMVALFEGTLALLKWVGR